MAWDRAMQYAEAHPNDLGYPWIDPASGTVEASAATSTGRNLLNIADSTFGDSVRVRDVEFSLATLQKIEDDVVRTLQTAGVVHADLIYRMAPDHLRNRIVISVREQDEQLLGALAARYGTRAIAILVDPDHYGASSATRNYDVNPFWGGAKIWVPAGACTDGFSWRVNGLSYMLTAGHCASSGGSVSTPYGGGYSLGTVSSGVDENWNTTWGTVAFPGENVLRGDLAFIKVTSGKTSSPYIYTGGVDSGTYAAVKYIWSRSPQVGDPYYSGGYASGQLLWTVSAIQVYEMYLGDGPFVIAANVTEGTKTGDCIQHGDSGGSVFTFTTGGVAAKGIISGMGWLGCYMYFTDIRLAYGYKGSLATT